MVGIPRRNFVSVLMVADVPDANGNVFSLEALQNIANQDPDHFSIEDNKLVFRHVPEILVERALKHVRED